MRIFKTLLQTIFCSAEPAYRLISRKAHIIVCSHDFVDFQVENEPVLKYLKGSKERKELEEELGRLSKNVTEVPIVIGGSEICSNEADYQVMPHNHSQKIAKFYKASEKNIAKGIRKAMDKLPEWDAVPAMDRIDLWLKAADLLAGKYRKELVAATMIGQGKTVQQAEIDAACELVDFMRFNAFFLKELLKYRPLSVCENTKNVNHLRALDGFVAAISPFNFTAIGGNLAYTPALCGNVVLWKPSYTAILSNWIVFKAMTEAGVPAGVVNFIPADGPVFGDAVTRSPSLGAINFTGSVPTFQNIWKRVGENLSKYNTFPRLLGECGGKNFHFVHPSADLNAVVASTIRSAFEYMGQKCSACSRLYVPESMWSKLLPELVDKSNQLNVGDVENFETFAGAVIDKTSFDKIVGYIEYAKKNPKLKIIAGGFYNDQVGYYVCPTVVVTEDPEDKIMQEEIFGPILTVYVYKDNEIQRALELVRGTTKYALTGSVFAEDEAFMCEALHELKYAAGNLYFNTKSTSAVVAQQPFGGGKLSGTNDKPGGPFYLLRFLSMQSLKQDVVPDTSILYEHMLKK